MAILDALRFGAQALSLRAAATKPPEEIAELQRQRLRQLVRHARENSSFFAEKYADIDGSTFQLTDLPTTSKSELMENFDRTLTVDDVTRADVEQFFTDSANHGRYFRAKYVLSHTSGSQGQPMLLVQSKGEFELQFALLASRGRPEPFHLGEVVQRLVDPVRLAAITLKPGFYPSASAFEFLPDGAQPFIKVLRLSITDENLVERLTEFEPTHLTAYASILHELAREVEAGRLSFGPHLQQVVNISERLLAKTRERYEAIFGAPLRDDYAMGECPFLTIGCLRSRGMHVNADWAILEVVDAENRPVPDGAQGAKVLITNLSNTVQPIIRYEIGDILSMATRPCDCGSRMPLVASVEGRDSDMFHMETAAGVRPLSPTIFELAMSQLLDVREYQLIQEEANRIRVRIEPLSGVDFDREQADQAIRRQLEEYELDQQVTVEIEVVDRLVQNGDGKFKRVVSRVESPSPAAA